MSTLAHVSVLRDDGAGGQLRVVLACAHGASRATLLSPAKDWLPDLGPVLAILAVIHEAKEGCGCAASVTAKEARA